MNPHRLIVSAVVATGSSVVTYAAPFELPSLPYGYDALEPFIGKTTLLTHHLKHHAKYVATANTLIESGSALLKNLSQEQIMTAVSSGVELHTENVGLFNNVAQSWNHNFYWHSMKPGGGGKPRGLLADKIEKDFGSYDKLMGEIEKAAMTTFGSGWAWLGFDKKSQKLVVTKTTGAGNPLTDGITPMLTIDVWEHAYYLDYQERRQNYVNAFFAELVNWDFAESNFIAATANDTGETEEL